MNIKFLILLLFCTCRPSYGDGIVEKLLQFFADPSDIPSSPMRSSPGTIRFISDPQATPQITKVVHTKNGLPHPPIAPPPPRMHTAPGRLIPVRVQVPHGVPFGPHHLRKPFPSPNTLNNNGQNKDQGIKLEVGGFSPINGQSFGPSGHQANFQHQHQQQQGLISSPTVSQQIFQQHPTLIHGRHRPGQPLAIPQLQQTFTAAPHLNQGQFQQHFVTFNHPSGPGGGSFQQFPQGTRQHFINIRPPNQHQHQHQQSSPQTLIGSPSGISLQQTLPTSNTFTGAVTPYVQTVYPQDQSNTLTPTSSLTSNDRNTLSPTSSFAGSDLSVAATSGINLRVIEAPNLETPAPEKITTTTETIETTRPPKSEKSGKNIDVESAGNITTTSSSISTSTSSTSRRTYQSKSSLKRQSLKEMMSDDCGSGKDFGFCPVSQYYPSSQVNAAIRRCEETMSIIYEPFPDNLDDLTGENSTTTAVLTFPTTTEAATTVTSTPSTSTNTSPRPTSTIPTSSATRSRSRSKERERERANKETWSWSSYRGRIESVCESELKFVEPGFARDSNSKWYVIVQAKDWPQRVPVDICRNPGEACKSLSDCGKRSRCLQRYTYHHLIVWDPDKPEICPYVKIFKFPISCGCQVVYDRRN